MKTFLQILFFGMLFLISTFPQENFYRGVIHDKPDTERLREIMKSSTYCLKVLNDKESLMLNSTCCNCQLIFKNLKREFYEEERFDAKDSRTTINKSLLDNGFLLLEKINQTWDGSAWLNVDNYSYIYDENNNLTVWFWQIWDGSAWVKNYKYSSTYDGNNNQIEELSQNWDGSAYVNDSKWSYTYDGNNNRTEELYQEWDGSAWGNYSKLSYTYDGNNNPTEYLYQTWDGSAWVNSWRYSLTYDGNNNPTEWLFQMWDGSAWGNYSKYSYTYDGNNNQTEELSQNWDGSAWVNYSKWSYTYDGNNNRTDGIYQMWDGSAWEIHSKYSYSYDENNNRTEWLIQGWDGSGWVNGSKISYTYDGNNNLIEELSQRWDVSSWLNTDKSIFSYSPTGIEQYKSEVSTYSLLNNFPNPFNPVTTIKYSIPQLSLVTIKVYDIIGNEISTLVNEEKSNGNYETEFNAASLSSGVYFYRIQATPNGGQAGNPSTSSDQVFIQTKKMILLK